jgi:hypothetical protein
MSSLATESLGALADRPDDSAGCRVLYVRTADPEYPLAGGAAVEIIRDELRRVASDADHQTGADGDGQSAELAELRDAAVALADAQSRRFRGLLDNSDNSDESGEIDSATRSALVRRVVLACAPLALRNGAWLQWLSAPGNADDPLVLRVLALYAADVGVGHPGTSRGDAYLAVLRETQLSEFAVPASRLTHDPRIADRDFYLAGLLLAMSRRPDDFLPEILGADLCLRTVGLLPPLAMVARVHPGAADWSVIDPSTSREPGELAGVDASLAAVELAVADIADGARRVLLGFRWALTALRHWLDEVYADVAAASDPAYDMADLLRLRAREGAVYHQRFTLDGRPLSDWLRQARTDPTELMTVLAGSKLVQPGQAERSALINGLVGERGPMFRVFAPEDLTVIARWINSLPTATGQLTPPRRSSVIRVPDRLLATLDATEPGDREPGSLREAYHLLQRRTDTPALRRYAVNYIRGWLARSRHGIASDDGGLPRQWGPEGLRPWLADQHDQHSKDFEATSDTPMPSRAALIDSTVQLAPLTLIDGAWLQGFTDYEHVSTEQGHFLFETYWDELGNGEPRLNHPRIYRAVLAEMDVHLPPTASREFAEWSGFRDSSFELPVYWLAIGRFPRTFMPEVLGLNLAMELSGVGGAYRRARIALKKYGFSTRFVDIHNTIDNVATGHSAWAADAVDTFLAAVPAAQGAGVREQIWQRVRVGFRSLNPPSGFLARQAFRRARRANRPK